MIKKYINRVGKLIPKTLEIAQLKENITDKNTLFLYGYFQYTGFKNFFKKVKQGIKAISWK